MRDDTPAPQQAPDAHATEHTGGGGMKPWRRFIVPLLLLAVLVSVSLAVAKHNRSDAFVHISLLWFAACIFVVVKSRSRLRSWALSAGILVFAFGLAEAYLAGWLPGQHRLYMVEPLGPIHELHPLLGSVAKKNASIIVRKHHGREVVFDVRYTTDANGLRIGPPRPDDASPSVSFLGDSLTFGWGVVANTTGPRATATERNAHRRQP